MDKIELPLLKAKDGEKSIPKVVIIGLVILAIILTLTFFSLTFKKNYTLHYSENSKLNYRVYLEENDFYDEKYLGKDQMYVASLIDYIDTDFRYNFKSDENIGLEYSYYIEAEVQVNNFTGENIYSKKEKLFESKDFKNSDGTSFAISENVKIDYDKYNDIAQTFIKEYGITAESTLLVNLYVNFNGKHTEFDKNINDKSVIQLKVPLTNKVLQIEMDYDTTNNNNEVLQYQQAMISNPTIFALSIVLAVIDIIAIAITILWIIKTRDPKTKYRIRLKKILNDYDKYISKTIITERAEQLMQTRSLRIVMLDSFEGLMNVRDNLGKTILYQEERVGEEAVFYIITENTGYIYYMKAVDFK